LIYANCSRLGSAGYTKPCGTDFREKRHFSKLSERGASTENGFDNEGNDCTLNFEVDSQSTS